MTDSDHALDAIARAATDLVPRLTERLSRHGLGEIEVADGELRLRLRGAAPAEAPRSSTASAPMVADVPVEPTPDERRDDSLGIGAPAVGFFVYADGLGPGLEVDKGDPLGHVEVLGVRHEVRAPRAGMVRNLVAESGEAVEYGQVVVEIEAQEMAR